MQPYSTTQDFHIDFLNLIKDQNIFVIQPNLFHIYLRGNIPSDVGMCLN